MAIASVHEYVFTAEHQRALRPELEMLLGALRQSDPCTGYFQFEWKTGELWIPLNKRSGNRFQDPPLYRVSAGVDWRVLRNFVIDYLRSSGTFSRIASLRWKGKDGPDNVMNVTRLEILESTIPVPNVVHLNNFRSASPIEEWEEWEETEETEEWESHSSHVIFTSGSIWSIWPSWPSWPTKSGRRIIVPEETRVCVTRPGLAGRRLVLYTFEGDHPWHGYGVLDPEIPESSCAIL